MYLTADREGQYLSSRTTIKNSDAGSSSAAGAIMPCVGGLIFWVDFPSKQCKGGNDWPGAVCGRTDGSAGLRQQSRSFDADEYNLKQT
jgi:hypothetical protein